MYAFIDRPVERLCNGGRFLLWAMRAWAGARATDVCPRIALSKCFAGVGAAPALSEFDTAMALVDRHSNPALAPLPMGCCVIGESEAILICLWRDIARGNFNAACETLALIVPEARSAPITEAMTTAARALAAVGFDLSHLSHQTQKEEK